MNTKSRSTQKHEVACVKRGKAYVLYANMDIPLGKMWKLMRKGVEVPFSAPFKVLISGKLYARIKGKKTGLVQTTKPEVVSQMTNSERRAAFGPLSVSPFVV